MDPGAPAVQDHILNVVAICSVATTSPAFILTTIFTLTPNTSGQSYLPDEATYSVYDA